MLLDLKPTTSIVDAIRERDRLDKTLLRHLTLRHGSGLRLLAAPADALEGAEVDEEAISRIVNMARRSFRYVVIDTFPMLDSVLMSILDVTDVAFIVVQGLAPAVAGIARLLPVLEGLGSAAVAAAPRAELQLQAVSRKPAAIRHRQPAAAHAGLRGAVRERRADVDEYRQSAHPALEAMGALRTRRSTASSRISTPGRRLTEPGIALRRRRPRICV